MDKRYLRFDIPSVYLGEQPDGIRDLTIVVKLDDEGVVVDLTDYSDEVLESTWKLYPEFGVKNIEFEEDADEESIV